GARARRRHRADTRYQAAQLSRGECRCAGGEAVERRSPAARRVDAARHRSGAALPRRNDEGGQSVARLRSLSSVAVIADLSDLAGLPELFVATAADCRKPGPNT